MAARTMARLTRTETPHTDWCSRDHQCGIDVHRSRPQVADAIGGRAVITRVRAADVDYIEVTARIPLHSNETGARWQVATTLRLMRELLAAIAIRPGVLRGRTERPAIGPTSRPGR